MICTNLYVPPRPHRILNTISQPLAA